MDEKTVYKKVGLILEPLNDQGIEIYKLQQLSDRIAETIISAYNLGVKTTNTDAINAVKDVTDTIYDVLKAKSDEWVRLHPTVD